MARRLLHLSASSTSNTPAQVTSRQRHISGASMLSAETPNDQANTVILQHAPDLDWDMHKNTTQPSGWPVSDIAEARALHHYIHRISVELDICDAQHHFSRFIPIRAASCPMMTHALLAFSSKHLSLSRGTTDDKAVEHYTKCLELLIPRLNNPQIELDDDVLATVLLLRKYEEYDDDDRKTHLAAAARMTNLLSTYAKSGGLREAASWVSLRQDSYVAFTQQQPLTNNLDTYAASPSLLSDTPEALANCAVLLWARALDFAFGNSHKHTSKLDMWRDIHAQMDAWRTRLPWNAIPIWEAEYAEGNQVFPEILMCHPAHVIALQHESLATIVLALYDPTLPQIGIGAKQKQKAAEDTARHHMKIAVGLARSNPQVENAFYTASHVLMTLESYLVDGAEQHAALDFLRQSCALVGWPPRKSIEKVRRSWDLEGTPLTSSYSHLT